MANTTFNPIIFSKKVVKNRDIKNVFYSYTNSDFKWELNAAWDTVKVQTLPTLSFSAWTAWEAITNTDFTITQETLLIDQTRQLRVTLKDIEIKQSDLTLESKVAERFAEAEARLYDEAVRDQILVTQVADIPAANKINDWAPVTLDKTNVFEEIEKMKVALAVQNTTDNLVLFVSPQAASLLRQSNLLDASDLWLETRKKWYMWMISWIKVVETNALTASKEMICMEDWTVNMVVQLNNTDVREWTDWFYSNLIAEIIYWLKIFKEQAKWIVINYVD